MAILIGTLGNDTLTSGAEDDLIFGLGGNDSLTGGLGNDTISAGSGNDTVNGGVGNDVLDGGLNADGSTDFASYQTANGAVTVNLATGTATGADGSDTLTGFEGVIGSNFDDTLIGSSGDDRLQGGLGNDTLDGGAGSDRARYRNASASVTVNLATGTSSGADGNDTLISIEEIRGSNFNDTLTGDAGDNVFEGGLGNDTLDGGAGSDTGDYNSATAAVTVDLLTGTSSGADGVDTLSSIENIIGGDFDDTLTGDGNANLLTGGDGADTLTGGPGDDTLDGGSGGSNDNANYAGAGGSVTVNLTTGIATGADGNDTLIDIEFVRGSNFDDTITGNEYDNSLRGNLGNDTLDGGGQSFALSNGIFVGDRADYVAATGSVTVNLLTGTATGADGNDTLLNFESIRGSDFADTLTGNDGDNFLQGRLGDDTLDGGAGIDFADYRQATAGISASLATNTSTGVDGADTLINIEGLAGSDFSDTLTGGAGNDWFLGHNGNDSINGGSGFDMVTYRPAGGSVTVNLTTGFATGADGTDTLTSTEGVEGSLFNDTLTGNNAVDNALFGLDGDDLLRQTLGADTLDGGAGTDRIDFTQTGIAYGGAVGVTVDLAAGTSDADNSSAGAVATLVSIESVTGTAGNDIFTGGDITHAPDILGNGVTESFRPLGGDDTITGATENGFNTRVDYSTNTNLQPVTVNLGAGTASDGFGGADTLVRVHEVFGGAGNDSLMGGSQERNNSGGFQEDFRGNSGNDTIDGAGTDILVGAAGIDRVTYINSPAAVNVNLATGTAADGFGFTDTLLNIDQAIGSAFNDTLTGGASNHVLRGRGGDDLLVGAASGVEASYQDSTTAIVASLLTGTVIEGEGEGGIDTLVNIQDLRGSDFDDTLIGNAAGNRFIGDPGADTIDGGDGIDFASYESGKLANGGINALIENGSGTVNDGWGSIDTLTNIEGVIGTHADDTLAGGLGDQWFIGRGGSDVINGGAGNDWVSYLDDPAGVTVNLLAGSATDGWGGVWALGGTDTLINIENVEGSNFADTISGNAENNFLTGGLGNDTMTGGDGKDLLYGGADNDTLVGSVDKDTLYGEAGDDTLDGGTGKDTLTGGLDNDTYTVDNAGDVVVEAAGEGFDTINSSVTRTISANVEKLVLTGISAINGTGGTSDDYIVGNTANNTLKGGAGNDLLNGGSDSGVDALVGGAGYDVLEGMDGNDTLSDAGGNNLFNGGAGADTMTGKTGNELFIGGAGNDTITTSTGADIIAFNRGDGQDLVNASKGGGNTLSIGGGIRYADMSLTKSGNNLELNLGGSSEKITLSKWYLSAPANKSVINLQVIAGAMADFDANSSDPLLNEKVQNFDFAGLVSAFDAASAPNNWALMNALLSEHLESSDTEALGGDLAYRYGLGGSLANIGFDPAVSILSNASFGTSAQVLQSQAALEQGVKRLS